jgi:hypothetical protein
MRLPVILAALCAAVLACSGVADPGEGPGGSGGSGATGGSGPPKSTFELKVIEEGQSVGFQPQIARAPDGSLGVAYLRKTQEEGACSKGDNAPLTRWEVVYAAEASAFAPEVVATTEVLSMDGIGLTFDDAGQPVILYQGGMDSFSECGGTDALMARRSVDDKGKPVWASSLVDGNGNAPVYFPADQKACAAYQDTCNVAGADGVVGQWPALAWAGGQPLAAYRDTHFGFAEDDSEKADLETSWKYGLQTLDATYGGGLYTQAAIDGDGNPALAHYNPTGAAGGSDFPAVSPGLWVIRFDGTNWVKGDSAGNPAVKFKASDKIGKRIGFAATGARLGLAWREDEGHRLRYVESADHGQTWGAPETADPKDDTGMFPSLAFDPAGQPAIAYYLCGRYNPDKTGCKQGEDALKYAVKTASGWKSQVVSGQSSFSDVTDAISLTFDGGGKAAVAFQRQTFDPESGDAVRQVVLAREVAK